MKDTLSNKLTSFIATLAVADTAAHQAIWRDQTPLSFTEELALARAGVTALGSAGAEQSAPSALHNARHVTPLGRRAAPPKALIPPTPPILE